MDLQPAFSELFEKQRSERKNRESLNSFSFNNKVGPLRCEVLDIDFVWFDSMGAKSACTRVETGDTSILIDPGAATMQPSYPLSDDEKADYRREAREKIQKRGEESDITTISHYHYDHHFLPDFSSFNAKKLLTGSSLWLKDPNRWINNSQWDRSRKFVKSLCSLFPGENFEDLEANPRQEEFKDPVPELNHAMEKDFGDYQERREELLEKWSERFEKWKEKWKTEKWIKEPDISIPVHYSDGKSLKKGETEIQFSKPLFHGIEYSQTGWVIATTIKDETGKTFIHSSDLQGPTIEDQADWIIDKNPDYLFLDGPATYLYGYMLNKTNLDRAVDNATRILKEGDLELFVYDHHLVREKKFRERTEKFWKAANQVDTKVVTAAELKGKTPKILELEG